MKNDNRETDGKYSYGMDRLCTCGHTLGQHLGSGPVSKRACVAHECDDGPDEPCACAGFKKAKGKK